MRKFFLVVFILLDFAVMAGAAFVLYFRITGPNKMAAVMPQVLSSVPGMGNTLKPLLAPVARNPALSTAAPSLIAPSPGGTAAPAQDNLIRKTFSYRNSRAKRVMIRAEFTGWKAEPMTL